MEKYIEYILAKEREITEQFSQKKVIYLDMKYWIYCRDAIQNVKHAQIYSLLQKGIHNQKLICPISDAFILELQKQSDLSSFRKTITIADELSDAKVIKQTEKLVKQQFLWYFTQSTPIKIEIMSPYTNVSWMIVTNCLHMFSNDNEKLDVLQKFERFSLSQIMSNNLNIDFPKCANIYKQTKADERDDDSTEPSRKSLFMHKISRQLMAHQDQLADAISCYKNICNTYGLKIDSAFSDITNATKHILQHYEHAQIDIPFLSILSSLDTHLQNQKIENIDPNDFYDHVHAIISLPYCDALFTEKKLANILNSLKFNEKYQCDIFYNDDNIIDYLKQVIR